MLAETRGKSSTIVQIIKSGNTMLHLQGDREASQDTTSSCLCEKDWRRRWDENGQVGTKLILESSNNFGERRERFKKRNFVNPGHREKPSRGTHLAAKTGGGEKKLPG